LLPPLAVACQLIHKLHQPSVLLPAQSIDFAVRVLCQMYIVVGDPFKTVGVFLHLLAFTIIEQRRSATGIGISAGIAYDQFAEPISPAMIRANACRSAPLFAQNETRFC